MATPYRAALDEQWEQLKSFCNEQGAFALKFPRTPAEDTIFHLAVFSKSKEPLKSLLDIAMKDPKTKYAYSAKNIYGNTALHEAAADGNIEAVELLVKHDKDLLEDRNKEGETPQLLEVRNKEGETPLFKAAAYGQTEVVEYLAGENCTKLKDIHRHRIKTDRASILHAAIQGENFETALKLLKLDKSLATLEDGNGMTSLQLLATMPSAFRSGYRMTVLKRLLYSCPLTNDGDFCCIEVRRIGLPILRRILTDKRKHKLAFKLTRTLIDRDTMWLQIVEEGPSKEGEGEGSKAGNIQATSTGEGEGSKAGNGEGSKAGNSQATSTGEGEGSKAGNSQATSTGEGEGSKPIALFLATERGIVEIVNEILKETPQLAEYIDDKNRNMLHIAIMHRQKEIFDLLKEMNIPMKRLVRGIDIDGYTILHHAADMTNDNADIHHGPAYHLQEELKWYTRVEKLAPTHFAMFPVTPKDDNKEKEYHCKELFELKHKQLLNDAQKWVKETSQSCSAVAVLVATVVFAAAYTVPGGSDEKGYPNFLNNNLFLVFTVMDVVALACSLTSVVMFLSVLTSPFSYEEFLHRLPQKLTVGFSLLFFALTTTMLAFTVTLLLIFRFQKARWTSTLIYTVAFVPVSIFALTQFPMYVAFKATLLKFYKWIKKVLPRKRFKKKLNYQGARPPV